MKVAMTPARRQALFNGLAVALLLLASGFGNTWVLAGSALALLLVGMVLVPEQRGRGLVTAVALFLPLVVWAFVGLTGSNRRLRRSTLWGYIAIGLLYHIALFATMPLYLTGILDGNGMGLWMLLAGTGTLALWFWLAKRVQNRTATT